MHKAIIVLLFFVWGCCPRALFKPQEAQPPPLAATFSIVAYDPATGELGIVVASRLVSVGAVVPWAEAGVGAVATQSLANTSYGPSGLELLKQGVAPQQTLEQLLKGDDEPDVRQVGIIDAHGHAASFTGKQCLAWAGHKVGRHYAVQGNILTGPQVLDAMAEAFDIAEGDLGDRMLAALAAGEAAGGDKRGKQAAAMLIVRKDGGYGGFNDRYRDLRVDDHENPVAELIRIYAIHKKIFPPPRARLRDPSDIR